MLDEATYAFGEIYPAVGAAHHAFTQARDAHQRSYSAQANAYPGSAWQAAMTAAHGLAAALRPLGETRIERCKGTAEWGTCNLPLGDDGQQCGVPHEHRQR